MASPRQFRHAAVWLAWLVCAPQLPAAEVEIPAEYLADTQRAVDLGARLWLHDDAGVRANLELTKRKILKKDRRIAGWITESSEGDAVVVTFVGEQGGAAVALYRARVAGENAPVIEKLDAALPLDEGQLSRWRARQAALQSLRFRGELCTDGYRPVVLPRATASGDRIFVYLLVPSKNPNDLVPGGHLRLEYSADGSILEGNRAFTKSCMIINGPSRSDQVPEAFMLTHLLDPTPTEIHVYLSLKHGKPVYVATGEFIWSVEGSEIRAVSENEP